MLIDSLFGTIELEVWKCFNPLRYNANFVVQVIHTSSITVRDGPFQKGLENEVSFRNQVFLGKKT